MIVYKVFEKSEVTSDMGSEMLGAVLKATRDLREIEDKIWYNNNLVTIRWLTGYSGSLCDIQDLNK